MSGTLHDVIYLMAIIFACTCWVFHLIPGMVGIYILYRLITGHRDQTLPVYLPLLSATGFMMMSLGSSLFFIAFIAEIPLVSQWLGSVSSPVGIWISRFCHIPGWGWCMGVTGLGLAVWAASMAKRRKRSHHTFPVIDHQ